jgi:predicted ester cyclase
MNAIDMIKSGLAGMEMGQPEKLAEILTDDMVFAGPVPEPVGKREFIGLQTALVKAMPDWKFNSSDFKQNGNQVTATFQITGTHTNALSLPMPGFPQVPATGKHVSLPKESITISLKNGKISRLEAGKVAGGGVAGVLTQLGIPLPQMP